MKKLLVHKKLKSWIKRKVKRGKNYLLKILNALGLKTWCFNPDGSPLLEQLGPKNCQKQFNLERTSHQLIIKENCPKKRAALYSQAYDEIYGFFSKHLPTQLNFGFNPSLIKKYNLFFKNKVVIDFGCGYGLSTELLSNYAKMVYGIDCSKKCIEFAKKRLKHLKNVEFKLITDLVLPFKNESIDSVYSNDLLEHLHPDDLVTHLKEIHRVLKKRGKYLFWTPGSESGPHDITSAFYPRGLGFKSLGLHLKEYTFGELIEVLKGIGYKKILLPDLNKEVLIIAEK